MNMQASSYGPPLSTQQQTMFGQDHPGSNMMGYGYDQSQSYDAAANAIRLPPPPMEFVNHALDPHFGYASQRQLQHHNQWTPPPVPYGSTSSLFYIPPPGHGV
jgi:hypothetical protein